MPSIAVGAPEGPFEPIDLDSPSPALKHWMAISSVEVGVGHDGDASKMHAFPRPAWSESEADYIGKSGSTCCYNSEWVEVASSTSPGISGVDWHLPASARVRAKMHGDGGYNVGVALRKSSEDKWVELGMNFTADEALELADVLRAAVALLGDDR